MTEEIRNDGGSAPQPTDPDPTETRQDEDGGSETPVADPEE